MNKKSYIAPKAENIALHCEGMIAGFDSGLGEGGSQESEALTQQGPAPSIWED